MLFVQDLEMWLSPYYNHNGTERSEALKWFYYWLVDRYIKCKNLADVSKKQVEQGTMSILPATFVQDWYRWLGNAPFPVIGRPKRSIYLTLSIFWQTIFRIGVFLDNFGGVMRSRHIRWGFKVWVQVKVKKKISFDLLIYRAERSITYIFGLSKNYGLWGLTEIKQMKKLWNYWRKMVMPRIHNSSSWK